MVLQQLHNEAGPLRLVPCRIQVGVAPPSSPPPPHPSSSTAPSGAPAAGRSPHPAAAPHPPFCQVEPQSDRVLVRLETIREKSAGGVLLPKSAVKFERYLMGEILSVGVDVSEVEAGKKVSRLYLPFSRASF
ncbi:hypothetical protein ZWY2020_026398 [Hordeum vulgare]|nr:hypothetical protein ZWY2020_026398 [Hordeum vulgare]